MPFKENFAPLSSADVAWSDSVVVYLNDKVTVDNDETPEADLEQEEPIVVTVTPKKQKRTIVYKNWTIYSEGQRVDLRVPNSHAIVLKSKYK